MCVDYCQCKLHKTYADLEIFEGGGEGGCSYFFPPFIPQGGGGVYRPTNDQNDFLGVKFSDQSRGAATPQLSH